MTEIKGMGVCLVPNDKGLPCGNQIEEGSPVGTVMLASGPSVGHKRCTDGHYARKMQAERENRENMVKLAKQGGPGGAVDMSQAEDAIENPTPLVKPEEVKSESRPLVVEQLYPTAEPQSLTDDEQAAMDAYKQKLLGERRAFSSQPVREALSDLTRATARVNTLATALAKEYDRVVAERDEVRSQRDTAKGISL